MSIPLTLLTSDHCALAKEYRHVDGRLTASTIANMATGYAKLLTVEDVGQLRNLFAVLTPADALCCGVPLAGNTPLVTRKQANATPGAVARTTDYFVWPREDALCAIDVDVEPGSEFYSVATVLDALERASPWLRDVHRVARPSSSSYVDTRGLRGVHVYFAVTDGPRIPDLGKRLQADQWLDGRGYVKVSRSGALLVRQLSDASIYQTQRILFEAAPLLGPDVTRRIPVEDVWVERARDSRGGRPPNHAVDGKLCISKLAPLKVLQLRQFETAVAGAKHRAKPQANRVAFEWHKARLAAMGWAEDAVERLATAAIQARDGKKLPLDAYLRFESYGLVSVGDVLAFWPDAVGESCTTPDDALREDLEPRHFTKAILTVREGRKGVYSYKENEFYAFQETTAPKLSVWMQAALRLDGCIEYPEPMKRGTPLLNVQTALAALLHEMGVKVRYNLATSSVEGLPYREIAAAMKALSYLGCHNLKEEHYKQALSWVAAENAYDPWRDAVEGLPVWDGIERVDALLSDVCGAPACDALTRTSQALFAGIVMRQLKPGVMQGVIPVLIGGQGVGKSYRFVKRLALALGCTAVPQIEFKEPDRMSRDARAAWIAELAEMSGHGRKDVEAVKLWATNNDDVYRDLYERDSSSHPRRFVLIGTANKHELNNDETGNRRFMPVMVTQPIDGNWTLELPQILAEARDRFCMDEAVYETMCAEASTAVLAYNTQDMRHGNGMVYDTIDDVLPAIMAKLIATQGKAPSNLIRAALDLTPSGRSLTSFRVGKWLTARGWSKCREAAGYVFWPPASDDPIELAEPNAQSINPFLDAETSLTKH